MSRFDGLGEAYDLIVIGGGVHGAATALEATRWGLRVALVEKDDFCAATSANTLRFIHGGLRYLQSADLRRSRRSAREQRRLLAAAPHLVRTVTCMLGTERSLLRGRLAMSLGIWFYDHIVCLGLGRQRRGGLISTARARRLLGMNLFDHCTGAATWTEAQVLDSERLVLTCLKTAEQAGARVLNYAEAVEVRSGNKLEVLIRDRMSGESRTVEAGTVIDTASLVEPHRHWARAVNLVATRPFPDCAPGMALANGSDGASRLYFAAPLAGCTLIGTWYFEDTPGDSLSLTTSELDACLADARQLLPDLDLDRGAVSRIHLGRLPVHDAADPMSLLEQPRIRPWSRDRRVQCVTGVKYTTAAVTARQALQQTGLVTTREARELAPWYGAGLDLAESRREVVRCFAAAGPDSGPDTSVIERLCRQYGAAAVDLARLAVRAPGGLERIPGCAGIRAEIDYCVEHEHCRTVADFLLRRSGLGSLGPPQDATIEFCAHAMGALCGWDTGRLAAEIEAVRAQCAPPLAP